MDNEQEVSNQTEPEEFVEFVPRTLEPGFYIVDSNGQLKSKDFRKRIKNEDGTNEFVSLNQPLRYRTIGTAKDVLSLLDGCAILCVGENGFNWG